MVSVEEIVRNNFVVVIGSMRKGAAAVAVAQRPDAGDVRLQLIINDYVAAVVGGDLNPVESQVVRVGSTSHSQKDVSACYFWRTFLTCEANGDTAFAIGERDTFGIQPNLHTLSHQDVAYSLGD